MRFSRVRSSPPKGRLFSYLILFAVIVFFFAGRYAPTRFWLPPAHLIPAGAAKLATRLPELREQPLTPGSPIVSRHLPAGLELPDGSTSTSRGGRLVFAHMGDGILPGSNRYMVTEFFLFNDSEKDSNGTLHFYDDAGNPLDIEMQGVKADSFPVSVQSGQFLRLKTDGKGSVKGGWAILLTDQPVSGTSAFSIRKGPSSVITDVGVGESILQKEFTLFADTKGEASTGLAVANPNPNVLNLHFELRKLNGQVSASADRSIPPLGHLALFVDQLFPNVANILDYEGTVIVTGDQFFGGITLRTVGNLWTSVPMVPMWDPNRWGTRLFFPQIADGRAPGVRITTTVILFNSGPQRATGTVEFLKSDGSEMPVKIGNVTASAFEYDLPSRGVRRMTTAASGAVQVGWGRVKMNEQIGAAAIFHIADGNGQLLAEVGVVPPLQAGNQFNVIADSIGLSRTGFALVNTNEEGDEADVELGLVRTDGEIAASKEVPLEAGKHQSLFFDQLFADVPGIEEFEGCVVVKGGADVVGMTLRQVGLLTTSLPSLLPVHGFAPVSVLEFAQNLAGTRPAVRWRIEQPPLDLALEKLEVSAPQLGLDLSQVQIGDEIGYGTYMVSAGGLLRTGGLVQLIATEKGSLKFDILASGPFINAMTRLFSGSLQGSANSNLKLTLGPTETRNGEWNNGFQFELDLMFRPGLFVSPAAATNTTITTTLTSASTKLLEAGVPVIVESTQPQSFVALAAGKARTFSVRPLFFSTGQALEIKGDRFGDAPTVGVQTRGGNVALLNPELVDATTLRLQVPDYVAPGAIWISRGLVAGNGHSLPTLFAPTLDVSRTDNSAATTVPFKFDIMVDAGQLALQQFNVDLLNVDRTLSGFAAGTKLGSVTVRGGLQESAETVYDMTVETSAAQKLELAIVEEGESDPIATLTVEKLANPSGLRFSYIPAVPSQTPVVNGFPVRMEFLFSGLPVTLPAVGEASPWTASIVSVPARLSGVESGLTAILGN